jgi:hypothetical protein
VSSSDDTADAASGIAPSEPLAWINIAAPLPSVEIKVFDAELVTVARGVGHVARSVEPGIYQLEFRAGAAVESRFITVGPGDTYSEGPRETVAVPSAAPLRGTSTYVDEHAAAASAASARAHRREALGGPPAALSQSAEIVVFLRRMPRDQSARGPDVPRVVAPLAVSDMRRLALLDGALRPVSAFEQSLVVGGGDLPWAAFSATLPPGPYVLRSRPGPMVSDLARLPPPTAPAPAPPAARRSPARKATSTRRSTSRRGGRCSSSPDSTRTERHSIGRRFT